QYSCQRELPPVRNKHSAQWALFPGRVDKLLRVIGVAPDVHTDRIDESAEQEGRAPTPAQQLLCAQEVRQCRAQSGCQDLTETSRGREPADVEATTVRFALDDV